MEKRWNVYHGNESLGLKTAKEIREALRNGTLDPFDKVALEGSNIREDLIEVDEIFRESPPEAMQMTEDPDGTQVSRILHPAAAAPIAADVPLTQLAPAPLPKHLVATQKPKASVPPTYTSAVSPPSASNYSSPGPSSAALLATQPAENLSETPNQYSHESPVFRAQDSEGLKAPLKRYYVLDKEKVLGPLSAVDIQALFNRGVLGKKVRVQKMGSSRAVPIAQFIQSYAGDRLKELAEDGKIPKQIGVGSPSSKVLNELARMADSRRMAKNQQNRMYLMLAGIVVLTLIIFSLLVERSKQPGTSAPGKSKATESAEGEVSREPVPASRPAARPRLVQKSPEKPAETTVNTEEPEIVRAPESRRAEPVVRATPRPARAAPVQPKAAPAKTARASPQAAAPPAKEAATSRRSPAPAAGPTGANPGSSPPNKGPISRATESVGRIQTIGPLTFSAASLDACTAKCNLTLRDAAGASMKAVFFKSAYYEQLKSRSKSVTLTGNTKLEGSELVLIIQDVR